MNFTVYSTKTCQWCVAAVKLLEQRNQEFNVKYIDSDPALVEEYKSLFPGKTSVPQIIVNEGDGFHEYVGGHDDLVNYLLRK